MKKLLLSLAAVAAVGAAAAPAAAQTWGDYGRYDHHGHAPYAGRLDASYVDGLNWKITNAARQGVISWDEARDLRGQLRSVQPLAYRVQTGRAREWEVRRLEYVVDRIDRLTTGYAYNTPPHRHDWR